MLIFVGIFAGYRIFFSKSEYVYIKIKVGQGYWWASTAKPAIWYVGSIKRGLKQYSFFGDTSAEITNVRYYAFGGGYDVFLTVKLNADYNNRKKEYTYNRSKLSIASPIDIDFPSVLISGTIIDISKSPFKESYVDKIIYLRDPGGYTQSSPFSYDNIKVGDKYFNGEFYSFEIIDKYLENSTLLFQDYLNLQTLGETDSKDIVVKAKVKLQEKNNQLIYGDTRVAQNVAFNIFMSNYYFDRFYIERIE